MIMPHVIVAFCSRHVIKKNLEGKLANKCTQKKNQVLKR